MPVERHADTEKPRFVFVHDILGNRRTSPLVCNGACRCRRDMSCCICRTFGRGICGHTRKRKRRLRTWRCLVPAGILVLSARADELWIGGQQVTVSWISNMKVRDLIDLTLGWRSSISADGGKPDCSRPFSGLSLNLWSEVSYSPQSFRGRTLTCLSFLRSFRCTTRQHRLRCNRTTQLNENL